jgi:hypothetical protein
VKVYSEKVTGMLISKNIVKKTRKRRHPKK